MSQFSICCVRVVMLGQMPVMWLYIAHV